VTTGEIAVVVATLIAALGGLISSISLHIRLRKDMYELELGKGAVEDTSPKPS